MNLKVIATLIALGALPSFGEAYVGPGHVNGSIKNVTSTRSGLMVKIGNSEVPENCTSGQTWMLIEKESATMISVALAAWSMGRNLTIYTDPGNSGYCKINQVDPSES